MNGVHTYLYAHRHPYIHVFTVYIVIRLVLYVRVWYFEVTALIAYQM